MKTTQLETSQKKFAFLGIVILFLLAIHIYSFRNQTQLKNSLKQSQAENSLLKTELKNAITSSWQVLNSNLYHFQIKLPTEAIQVKSTKNYQNLFTYQWSDKSTFQIIVTDANPFTNLTEYLKDLDTKNSTSWEGKPATQVQDSRIEKIGNKIWTIRTEKYLAGDFIQKTAYLLQNKLVFAISVRPSDQPNNSATSSFDQILETFTTLQ